MIQWENPPNFISIIFILQKAVMETTFRSTEAFFLLVSLNVEPFQKTQMTTFLCASLCRRPLVDAFCTQGQVWAVHTRLHFQGKFKHWSQSAAAAGTPTRRPELVCVSASEGWLMKHFQTVGSCFSEESHLRSNISTGGGAEPKQVVEGVGAVMWHCKGEGSLRSHSVWQRSNSAL